MSILVAGPWIGEFGWELMCWQGMIRAKVASNKYEKVIILNTPGKEDLYNLPNVSYEAVKLPERCGYANGYGRYFDSKEEERKLYDWCISYSKLKQKKLRDQGFKKIDFILPKYGSSEWTPTFWPYQKFVCYSKEEDLIEKMTIALVIRNRSFGNNRNHGLEWWKSLADRLINAGFVVLECPHILKEAMKTLSTADLAIGGSTGGLHLASLCGCPHYVWGGGSDELWGAGPWNISNRIRYEWAWNPLGTPVIYDALGWQPKVEDVYSGTMKTLEKFARISPDFEINKKLWRKKLLM